MIHTRQNEYWAYFTVAGDFDPADLSARIGLEPTRSWKRGDINPKTQLERKASRWCLDSRLEKDLPLEAHVDDVLEQLEVRQQAITEVSQAHEAGMQLVAYFHSSYPGFGLEQAAIKRMAAFNLSFDCDFYFLYSDKREDS